MKTTLSTSQAANLLREDTNANWSRTGAYALVEYLEELEQDIGEEIEFNVVALRCDYSEHSTALEAALEQGFEPTEEDEGALEREALEWLQDRTQVIEFQGGIIIQSF